MHDVGSYLGKGGEDEPSHRETGMGDGQFRFVDHFIAIQKYIQVNGPRSPTDIPPAVEDNGLYALQFNEKIPGREGGLQAEDGVQVVALAWRSDRLGVVETGEGGYPGFPDLADLGNSSQKVQFPVSEVGAKGDEGLC